MKEELFQKFSRFHIPEVRITKEEYGKYYGNCYNILGLQNSFRSLTNEEIIFALEDAIRYYLLLTHPEFIKEAKGE